MVNVWPCRRLPVSGQGLKAKLIRVVRLQIVPVALPSHEDSYHCCMASGEEIYERFLKSTTTCTHSILLHPV